MTKPRRKVLVIDSSAGDFDDYRHQLRQDAVFAYQVITEQASPQLLTRLPLQEIDGILLNLEALSPDEITFLDNLQQSLTNGCPPVVVVGWGEPEGIIQAFKHGAADYLVKDKLTDDDLCRALRIAIEKAELKRQLQLSHQHFQASVECLMDCFGIFTAMRGKTGQIVDFRIDYLNQAACENNRIPREQQLGRGLCEMLPGHHESGLFEVYCHLVETGEPIIKDSVIFQDTFGGQQEVVRAFDIRATKLGDGFVSSWRDITERKRMELELGQTVTNLQQEQSRLQRLIDTAPIGIGIGTADGAIKVANDAMLALHGCDREAFEQQGMNWWDAIPQESVKVTEQEMVQLRQQGNLPPQEKELQRRDGTRVPVWISATQWVYSSDEHVTFAVDLTQQKQTEAALRESEKRYRDLAEAMPQIVWTADAAGAINYWNQRWYEYTGFSEAESMGVDGVEAVHPDERDLTLAQWYQALSSQEPFEIEYRIRRSDGRYRWFMCRALPSLDTGGKVKGWIGTITDIEALKQAKEKIHRSEQQVRQQLAERIRVETALLENEKLLRLALEGANAGSWTWEIPTGKITWSPETFKLFGCNLTQGAPSYEDCLALMHPDDRDRVNADVMNVLEKRFAEFRTEFRIIHPQTGIRWLLSLGRLTVDQQGKPIQLSGIVLDITAQKTATEKREQLLQQEQSAREAAERANRIKDEFLAILSHELRSPLNPILGWSKLLQTKKLDEAKISQALDVIERNAKLQTQLIDDLLDVARILRGKLRLQPTPIDLRLVIQSAIDTVTPSAEAKSIDLQAVIGDVSGSQLTNETSFLPPAHFQITGDDARLQQIIWNLLSNAIKFTPEGGRVELRLEQVDNHVQITVKDNGKGISPDFLPYLFESFRQEDVSITRQYGGLGLGLAIVRYLVEAHGGTISADSPGEGLGATFTVKFPLLEVQSTPQATAAMLPQAQNLNGIRVLAVDDDPDSRDLLEMILTFYGAEVQTVSSAAEVLSQWHSLQPDILLSDIGMPDIDGYDLIQRIRALSSTEGRQVPAIAISAYTQEIDKQKALASGYQRHIAKPLEVEQLVMAVARLVRERDEGDEGWGMRDEGDEGMGGYG